MALKIHIIGGTLQIDKKIFIKEMLRPNSVMKKLINYSLEDHGKKRSLKIDRSKSNTVIIDYNFVDKVEIGMDYQNILENLKRDMMNRIKGSITLILDDTYENMFFTIDFNSDGGEIEQAF